MGLEGIFQTSEIAGDDLFPGLNLWLILIDISYLTTPRYLTGRQTMTTPSQDYINYICSLYGSSYDDRIENTAPPTAGTTSRIPGDDWTPGTPAAHKSLIAFQRELAEQGIRLSTSKIKKILITGGLWTTQQTRTIQEMFWLYTSSLEDGGEGMDPAAAIKRIADELEISTVSVSVSLPYSSVVYNLENRSSNAKRCARYKERRKEKRL